MGDPARVYALKYADLEAERDCYRDALALIRDEHIDVSPKLVEFINDTLGDQ